MAIFHLSHKKVGRSTHAASTAGAHADYIERKQACRISFGEHMPTKRGATRRWLDEQEQSDRKNARVIDKLTLALPLELDEKQRIELIRAFVNKLTDRNPQPDCLRSEPAQIAQIALSVAMPLRKWLQRRSHHSCCVSQTV